MARVKDLTEVTIADLWREVKEQFWEDVNTETLRMIRRLLQSALEEELLSHLQATWYQRNPDRQGYRNGYRKRIYSLALVFWKSYECPEIEIVATSLRC